MTLMANEIERIYVELVMGVPQSESLVEMGDEAKIVWEKMSAEIAQMREEGKGFEIQHEMPSIDLPSPSRSLRYSDEQSDRAVSLAVPDYIRTAATKGLEYNRQGLAGDGLTDQTLREARAMADGDISDNKVVRASAWAKRHAVDLESPHNSNPNDDKFPAAGAVAHYLWGINPLDPQPARDWFDRKSEAIQNEDDESPADRSVRFSEDQPRDDDGKFGSGDGGGSSKDDDSPTDDDELQEMMDNYTGSEEYASEAENIMSKDQKEYSEGLSETEFEAVKDYTGLGYQDVNKALRGAPPPPLTGDLLAENLERANMINKAILSSPAIDEPVTVFRGVNAKGSEFYDLAVGDVYQDSGVVSTSFSKSIATGFGGSASGEEKVLLQIDVKKGSQALIGSNFSTHNEYELMLPSNTQFKVTDVRQEGDTRIVVVSAGNG